MLSIIFLWQCVWMNVGAVENLELADFGVPTLPAFVASNNAILERVPHNGGYARLARFKQTDWPNVFFQAPPEGWDWSAYEGVAVSLYNPSDQSVPVALRVDNAGADGSNHCNNAGGGAPPKSGFVLSLRFNTGAPQTFWGMRGVPGRAPLGTGAVLDTSKITAFQVFLPRPQAEYELIFERAWLFGKNGIDDEKAALPFIDRFGQYKHEDWPGKVHDEKELEARRAAETAALADNPVLPGRDSYGGWAEGPQLDASGWFRTQKVDGKWWLVTPSGHLFFSNGVDCVWTGEQTFVEGRSDWFEWLPKSDDPLFGGIFANMSGAHSGADVIGGKGLTFSFYRANLYRKYGSEWFETWRGRTYSRLRAWGLNTLGNWTPSNMLEGSPIPYVVPTGLGGVPPIAGAEGYWAKMMDVYDPVFEPRVDAAIGGAAGPHAGNPYCIGYFVDNELAWEGVAVGALRSPAEQPCRKKFIEELQAQYPTLEALNTAWETKADSWDAVRAPDAPNRRAQADLDAFLYQFARRYFETIQAAVRRYAPHQLYLGCRFAAAPKPAVRAAADCIDIVSFNLYYEQIAPDRWVGDDDLGKPLLIGEFHFGALDRGMFHAGLVAAANQQERAASYARYVRSVADHPAFVGCHWFQYVDEPVTGRWFDGENYNIGLIDVTDTPYPELTEAARRVHAELYSRRAGSLSAR